MTKNTKILRSVFTVRMLTVFLFGISSGLPLLLIGSTLKAWMKTEGVDLSLIGAFALVGLPYTLKFLWSPLLDRFVPPKLGRRKGWILICQLTLSALLLILGLLHPSQQPALVALLALGISFFSATQDVAIDAYRREILPDSELGLGASMGVNGYRIGMLFSSALALPLADQVGWQWTYFSMAGLTAALILVTILAPMPQESADAPKTLRDAVVLPFVDYFRRKGAIEILVFILLFKIGDQMASDMFTPFYIDMGFTLTQIGIVSKAFGVWATIVGGVLGGIVMIRIGIYRSLWIFGVLQALSTLAFSGLAHLGNNLEALAGVVAFENLSSGMGTAAYVGMMGSLCDRRFTATQYALLSSLTGVPRVLFGSTSGMLAQEFGWSTYFIFCALIAIPGLLMLFRVNPESSNE